MTGIQSRFYSAWCVDEPGQGRDYTTMVQLNPACEGGRVEGKEGLERLVGGGL